LYFIQHLANIFSSKFTKPVFCSSFAFGADQTYPYTLLKCKLIQEYGSIGTKMSK